MIHKPQQASAAYKHFQYSDGNYVFGVFFFERHQDLASIEFVFHCSCLFACIPDILLYQKAIFPIVPSYS